MVQAGRVACITLPFVLTLGALVCLVLVFLAGTIEKNDTLDNWYFLKVDLTNITFTGSDGSTALKSALQTAKDQLGLKDYYTIYLRNYCAWNGDDLYSYCSPRESKFYFNPVEVWGLNTTSTIESVLPESLTAGLATYKAFSIALFYVYTIGLSVTAVTILVGFFAIFSRWGSFFTTFFASLSALMIVVASILATAMFPILKEALHKSLDEDYGTVTTTGSRVIVITWIGAAFAVGSSVFWLLSICCCSGRSPYNPGGKDARRTRAERTPYTYERVGSPYLGPRESQAVPLSNMPGHGYTGYSADPAGQRNSQMAYEPFRPQHV